MTLLFVLLLAEPAEAATTEANINAPAGTLADVAFSIGRQTGVSISLQGGIADRRAPAIRGRMAPATALRRLAEASGLTLRSAGTNSFVLSMRSLPPSRPAISARRPSSKPRPLPARSASLIPEAPAQEIVVTASRRDTLAKRFAGQWTRIDGRDLGLAGVVGTDSVAAKVPGMSSTHLGAGRNKLFIRGIADSSFSGTTQSPVGIYFGDLRTGYSGPDPDLRLVDMDSVEVLEGPQGTLYGAGALGGILLLKPNLPEFGRTSGQASSGASLTQHGNPGADLAVGLNAPIARTSAVRLSAYHAQEGGYVDNRLTGEKDINRVQVLGGRLIASVTPTLGWRIDLTASAQSTIGSDSQYADDTGDGLTRASLVQQPFRSDYALTSFVLHKDAGDLRFRTTTGATWQKVVENFDASLPGTSRRLLQRSRAQSLTNETRLWRPMQRGYSWLAGLSLLDHDYRVDRSVAELEATRPLGGVRNHVAEITLYGEIGVELSKDLEASVGGRYTYARLKGSGQHLSLLASTQFAAIDRDRTERQLLPSASLLYRPLDGLSLYTRYQQGFRPGGLSIADETVTLYRRDLLRTAEAGFRFGRPRSDWLDLAGSLTWSRWTDIQADYLDGSGSPVTNNIGDGRVWSATINGGLTLGSSLRLEAGLAWNDGRITTPSAAFRRLLLDQVGTQADMRIPNIARLVSRIALDFRKDLGRRRLIEVDLYGRYVGSSRLGVGAVLGDRQGNYFDSGVLARLTGGQRAYSLSITNLADQVGNRFAFGAPSPIGQDQLTPLRPRTIRLGLDWTF